ncbi:YncE family protein [Flavisolibacter nicotianae]|uniref:YncE family protein n=1 Tax=Flavisolibacter nicotianae TaxID=2364882 RepID=UPI001F0935E6|nr:hypothetical protein [Flavisolibacter nicotianae]
MDTRSFNIVETIATGIFKNQQQTKGSSLNGLALSKDNRYLYVSNGLDNAVAIIWLGKHSANRLLQKSLITGSIPTEACPAGLMVKNNLLVVANLESTGAHVSMPPKNAMVIDNQLASVSIIPLPSAPELKNYTRQVYQQNMMSRLQETNLPPRKGTAPQPVPQRLGEPSVFKHVVYIIKENKTYD